MARPGKGSRLKLGEPLATDFIDFRAANYNAQEIEVIREALREHINRRLKERATKRRFDNARRERLTEQSPKARPAR
jgi:hypothetical protein